MGRYVADGFINKHLYNSVLFAICNKKEPEFLANVPCEFKDKFRKFQKSCIEYRIADKDFHDLCMEFGNGAINKHIPEWLFSANMNQIEHFLNGYFSGDGHVRYRSGNKVQMFTTVSKDLFLGLQLLILKCYGKVCSLSIRHDNRKTTFNDTYNGQISFSVSAYQKIINDKIFVSIKSIEKVENKVHVYNLEVRKDNSYTCDNVNTHNCTDISSAGQQKGLTEGSGRRSSLLWECRKAIEIKKPKYLLMENVKALTSKKFMPYLQKWLAWLDNMGYTSYTKVLNAKDYGVPQNRERVFVVSILNGDRYYFPKPFQLEKRLKDVLEENVDEKYYLSKKLVNYIFSTGGKDNNIKGGIGVQDGSKITNCITANYWKTPRQGNYLIEKYGNKRVQSLVDSGKISGDKVEYIDAYNQSVSDLCGTIRTTIDTSCMMITEPRSCAMRGRNPDNPSDRKPGIPTEQRIELVGEVANCITTVQKDSLVLEPNVLSPKRNEYGKEVRKAYERGEYKESRHNMTNLEPRNDGITNTITTVQKDNLLVEPKIIKVGNYSKSGHNASTIVNTDGIASTIMENHGTVTAVAKSNIIELEWKGKKMKEGDGLYISTTDKFFRGGLNGVSRTLKAESHDAGVIQDYRIRKLTPRECFRLMGVSEENIDKIQSAGISRTQQYKMAGNSIVVDVLYHIFRKMFIDKSPESGELSLF